MFELMADTVTSDWKRALVRLFLKIRSWAIFLPAVEVELFQSKRLNDRVSSPPTRRGGFPQRTLFKSRKMGACISANGTVYILQSKQEAAMANGRKQEKPINKGAKKLLAPAVLNSTQSQEAPRRYSGNGGSSVTSLFTKQGQKGVNQDAMLVLENFTARADTIFCGVFDGHGPDGHLVSQSVRDTLPQKLATCQKALLSSDIDGFHQQSDAFPAVATENPELVTAWKESFLKAFKLMDRELLVDDKVDCFSSGTTAVTLVKQGNDLFIGSVGDSRAILGLRTDDNSLMALQLTIDLKPDLPREAERIRRSKGRVFSLHKEPLVKRVWLPHRDMPGLAMARALGDYCLKNFGVISEPVITYRRLTRKDKFIVLATDGVWDVLSNEQVTEIVASESVKSLAAKAVVDAALCMWSYRYSTSRVDDCAVVCLFLDQGAITSSASAFKVPHHCRKRASPSSLLLNSRPSSTVDKSAKLLTVSSQNVINAITTEEKGIKKPKMPIQPTKMIRQHVRERSGPEGGGTLSNKLVSSRITPGFTPGTRNIR